MELNIQEIAIAKIEDMHDSGKVKAKIEESIEKTVLDAISNALSGYEIRREIEKQVSESVSDIVKSVGFSGYNGFIVQKIKEITEQTMRDDVSAKIQKIFNDMLIARHDGIKLSEIVDAYRKYLFDSVDERDKWERREFTLDIDEKSDGGFTWHTFKFNEEAINGRQDPDIMFKILVYGEKTADKICSLCLSGTNMERKFKLGNLNEVEALLANLYFNETPIILDFDDIDDSCHYDIDD